MTYTTIKRLNRDQVAALSLHGGHFGLVETTATTARFLGTPAAVYLMLKRALDDGPITTSTPGRRALFGPLRKLAALSAEGRRLD